ncbi:MAG: hypothetical protein J5722_09185 [Oscillospiraceae bacterium]|nr:hypothetical protein [Oscillospiraceae bacterium]
MNYYVDIHANLLPGMAGLGGGVLTGRDAEERLSVFHESNIKLAVAAPYYDPEQLSPEEFLAQRDEKIAGLEQSGIPVRIVGGAVLPFSCCLEMPRQLRPFTLGASGYFLIDLPEGPVTAELCEQLTRLRIVSGMCPIAADVDRCFASWSPEDWIALKQTGILLQMSVNGLLCQEHRKLALYLLANQYVHLIATGSRAVTEQLSFAEAMRIVQRSLPAQYYRRVKNNAGMLLSDAEPSVFH